MMQAGFSHFAPAQTRDVGVRLLGASLALTRHAAGHWAKLVDAQFAFAREGLEVVLDELSRAGADDPRRVLLDWQMAAGRRLAELGLRHLRRTGELMVEGQRDLLAELGRLAGDPAPAAGAAALADGSGAETVAQGAAAGTEAAADADAATADEQSVEGEPAAEGRRRASRREASAA